MQRFKEHGLFIAILLLSSMLRFMPLFDYEFTYDELSGLDRTQFNDLSTLLDKGVRIDAHPALIQVLIYFLVKLFGYVNWIVKLPFLLFGQLAIVYAYLIGLRNFSKQSGLVASLLFSFSLIFVFYAPIARMYSAGVFFSLGLLYYFMELLYQERKEKKIYFLFGLFALLSALNHHINGLFAFTVAVSGLFLIQKAQRRFYLITCGLAVLAYLPHLPITLYQLSVPGIGVDAGGWLTAPDWTALPDFVRVLFGTGYCFLIFLLLALAGLFYGLRHKQKAAPLLLFLFLVNFAIVFFYSLLRSPIFQYSVMLFAGTALILAVSAYCDLQRKGLNALVLVLVFIALAGRTYVQKDYLHQAVRTVYEYQFTRTAEYKTKFGNDKVYPLFFDCDTLMRNLYFKSHNLKFDLKMSGDTIINYGNRTYVPADTAHYNDTVVSTLRLFSEFVKSVSADYLVLSSAPPGYQAIAKQFFPYLIENTQTQAINFKVYSRQAQEVVEDDRILYQSDNLQTNAGEYPGQRLPFVVESEAEYPYKVSYEFNKIVSSEGQYILSQVQLRVNDFNTRMIESCISINDSETENLHTYSGKSAADYTIEKDSLVQLYSDAYVGRNYPEMQSHSQVHAYVWNRGKNSFRIERFKLQVIDYWPQKWQWWD